VILMDDLPLLLIWWNWKILNQSFPLFLWIRKNYILKNKVMIQLLFLHWNSGFAKVTSWENSPNRFKISRKWREEVRSQENLGWMRASSNSYWLEPLHLSCGFWNLLQYFLQRKWLKIKEDAINKWLGR